MPRFRSVFKQSSLYMISQLLSAAVSFFLLPIYTRKLTPSEYGITSVVISSCTFLVTFLNLELHGAANRLYFEDSSNENYTRSLWGSIVSFMLLLLLPFGLFMFFFGEKIYAEVLHGIPFYPYMALGLVTIALGPVFDVYQTTLRVRKYAGQFVAQNLSKLFLTVTLSLIFVVGFQMQAKGVLLANAIVACVFFIYSLLTFVRRLKLGLNRKLLRASFSYSLPYIPATFSSWILSSFDRVLLSQLTSTASAGIYSIGATLGGAMGILTASFNDAYSPYFLSAMKTRDRREQEQVRKLATLAVGGYVIAALGLSLFSKELLGLMTSKAFHGAWQVVPFMAFANVITGVERLLRAPIQFHLRGGKFVSIVTLAAAVAQGTLLFVLIPRFGFIGIGLTYVIVGSLVALTFGWIANSIEKFDWDYRAFIQLIFLGISGCAALLYLTETAQVHYGFFLKTAGFLVLSFVVLVVSTGGITEIQQNLAAIQDILSSKLKRVS